MWERNENNHVLFFEWRKYGKSQGKTKGKEKALAEWSDIIKEESAQKKNAYHKHTAHWKALFAYTFSDNYTNVSIYPSTRG